LIYPSVSLIIPCYNESNRLAQTVLGIKEFLAAWHGSIEIIIVDDGSTDGSVEFLQLQSMIQALMADDKLKIITQKNTGKGGAIQAGIAIAKHDYCLTLDADMATHPTEIINWALLSKSTFDQATISIASRTLANSKLILISNRRNKGKMFNTIVRRLTGLQINDTQCGFKLYPTAIAKQLFANLQTKGWAHDVEIILRAKQKNIALQEMPITWNERDASKINVVIDGFKMMWEVVRIVVRSNK
jgi:dolichyl-phosphate beta-glucosyltransferase